MRLLYQDNTATAGSFKIKLFVSTALVFAGVAFSSSAINHVLSNSNLTYKNNTLYRKLTVPITKTDVYDSLVSSVTSAVGAVSSVVTKAVEVVQEVTGTSPPQSGGVFRNPWYWGGGFGILGLLSLLFFFV